MICNIVIMPNYKTEVIHQTGPRFEPRLSERNITDEEDAPEAPFPSGGKYSGYSPVGS